MQSGRTSTHREAPLALREGVALQLLWPGNAKVAHQTLAALSGPLAEGPAGTLHLARLALGDVHHAHKEADVHLAHSLHKGVEEGHLGGGLPLAGMAQQVGGHGLVVGQSLADGDGDWLAELPAAAHPVLGQDTQDCWLLTGQVNLPLRYTAPRRRDSPPCRTQYRRTRSVTYRTTGSRSGSSLAHSQTAPARRDSCRGVRVFQTNIWGCTPCTGSPSGMGSTQFSSVGSTGESPS